MNHFVLDANTVIAEQYGASAHMRALLSASSAVGFQVHLPKVALEEIAAKYERELSNAAEKAWGATKRFTDALISAETMTRTDPTRVSPLGSWRKLLYLVPS